MAGAPGLPARAEVVVIGGGVIGTAIACELARRGVRELLLLERGSVCSGSTRHSTAIIRLHYTQRLLVRMALHGLRTYEAFDAAVGTSSGFVRTGMLFAVEAGERPLLEANVALGRSEGVATHLLDPGDVAELDPRIAAEGLAFCFEPGAGYCDPYLVTSGFAAAATRGGARIVEGVAVHGVHEGRVETDAGPVETGAVVLAAGWSTPALLASFDYELPIRPARAEVGRFRLPRAFGTPPPALADFSAGRFYFRPAEAGYLEVGSLDPREAERPIDPERCPEGAERETLDGYHAALAARLHGVAGGHWRGGWSGIYDVTPDWKPAVGRVPGSESVFVAAGFSGHGFKLAPAVALAMAELVCDGRATSFDLGLLAPDRFARGQLVGARYGYSVLG